MTTQNFRAHTETCPSRCTPLLPICRAVLPVAMPLAGHLFYPFYHLTGTEINPSPVSSDALRHPPLVACAPATSSHGWHHHHHIMAHRLMFTCPSAASPARPSAMVPHAYSCPGAPSPRGEEVISEVCCLLCRCEVWRMKARA